MPITQQQFLTGPSTQGGVTLGLTSADLAAGSVTSSAIKYFIHTETGTGSQQTIAHGLGVAPSIVMISFTGATASQAIAEGTHTSTNLLITVTNAATYKVLAIA